MSRFRFTLAQLMAVVFYFGFGFAALRNATNVWASATFSVAIISVAVALAAAAVGKGQGRMAAAGFATAGGARLVVWLLTAETVGSFNGPPRPLLYIFQPYLNPAASGGGPYISYVQTCNSLDVILLGLVAAAIGHFLAAKDEGPNR
jgi:hypothetical protein